VSVILGLLGFIPGVLSFAQSITSSIYDAKVRILTAKVGGDRDVAVSLIHADAQKSTAWYQAIGTNKYLMFLVVGFALPWMVYEWKVVVYDVVLGWGSTDVIGGRVGDWGQTIIISIFGSGTTVALGQMYFNRRGADDK
jgi:protein-disulfide isomerase